MPRGPRRQHESNTDRAAELFGSELVCDPLFFERSARAEGYCCIAGLDVDRAKALICSRQGTLSVL